VLFRSIMALR